MQNKEFSLIDSEFMQEALLEAKKAAEAGEVPVGAVLVMGGKIIARSSNCVEALKDATAHAELLVIQQGAKAIGDWRLVDSTLYTTLEPCSMCAGAAFLSRVGRIVWGAPDLRHGANGSFIDLFAVKHKIHSIKITSGVLQQECAFVMREFFKEVRENKKDG